MKTTMNSLEHKMVELLKDMKKNFSLVAIKAELEAEGSRLNELMRLKDVAEKVGLGIILKLGGCEAVTDLFEAQKIGVEGLVAPMIESSYALKKYIGIISKNVSADERKDMRIIAMIETVQGYKNVDSILSVNERKIIDTISVGRVDFSGSLGLERKEINTEKVHKYVFDIFSKAKKTGLRTVMGGGIDQDAIPFIKKLTEKKLLDRYETRKIIFATNETASKNQMEEGIIKANLFELFWLQNKKKYYTKIYLEDDARIEMLMSRIYKIQT